MTRWTLILLSALVMLPGECLAADKSQTKRRHRADSAFGNKYRYEPNGINNIPTGPVAGGRTSFQHPNKQASLGARAPKRITDGISPFAPPAGYGGVMGGFPQTGPGFGGVGAAIDRRAYDPGTARRSPDATLPEDDAESPAAEEQFENEPLANALTEITKAWKDGDGKTLQARFAEDKKVSLFQYGKYTGETTGLDLGQQVASGAAALKTSLFRLNAPRSRGETQKFVSGVHVFTDASQVQQTAYVSYVLEQVKGRWMIVEYGWSDRAVSGHSRPQGQP